MASALITKGLDQLPRATALSPAALTLVEEPNGPTSAIGIAALLGHLISTDTAKETQADLIADLAHDASAIALVYADPNPDLSGWYRKIGAANIGGWAQFETLSRPAVAEARAAMVMAEQQADRAEGLVNAMQTTAFGGWYDDASDVNADPAVEEGDGFEIVTPDGQIGRGKKVNGQGQAIAWFTTRSSLRNYGINLWEEAKYGASDLASDWTATVAAILQVQEDAALWKIGAINCGGRNQTYVCGGDYLTFGDFDIATGGPDANGVVPTRRTPFRRGRIPIRHSNIEFRGASAVSRAKFQAAPGDLDPGPLFCVPFWEPGLPTITDVSFRWLEIDGNEQNQTLTPYARNVGGQYWWIQGHAFALTGMERFALIESEVHGWRGHGVFGFTDADTGKGVDDFLLLGNDVHDNMQGGAQFGGSRFRSIRNDYHGNGGLTALGPNIEVADEATKLFDILSAHDRFDGRDGLSALEARVNDFNGYVGLATDDPAAQAARRHRRRGMWISGNYYTRPNGNIFGRQRGRIQIVAPELWMATLGIAGADRAHVMGPISDIDYETEVAAMSPGVGPPILISPAISGVTGYDQVTVSNAIMSCDVDEPVIQAGAFRKANISAQITGGRNAAVRLEGCGGKVDIQVENVGTATTRADWLPKVAGYTHDDGTPFTDEEKNGAADALIGSTSSAVAAFGTIGPLDINVQAIDTRAAADRQMQYSVYANVSVDYPTTVNGTATNMLLGTKKDVNNAVIDRGLLDNADRTVRLGPTEIRGLTAFGNTALVSEDGPLGIDLRSPAGTTRTINFVDDAGLEGQITQNLAGEMQFTMYQNGQPVGTPFVLTKDGTSRLVGDYTRPIQITTAAGDTSAWMWASATGVLRIATGRPEADTDGVAVGSQA